MIDGGDVVAHDRMMGDDSVRKMCDDGAESVPSGFSSLMYRGRIQRVRCPFKW
jgi:hypothetical protein